MTRGTIHRIVKPALSAALKKCAALLVKFFGRHRSQKLLLQMLFQITNALVKGSFFFQKLSSFFQKLSVFFLKRGDLFAQQAQLGLEQLNMLLHGSGTPHIAEGGNEIAERGEKLHHNAEPDAAEDAGKR